MSRLCRLRNKSHGEDGQWAYEEITKLREQVAAQASEIESLRISYDAACMLVAQMHEAVMGEVIGPYHGVVEDVRTKVAAQAAVIEKLREALSNCLVEHPDKPFVHLAAWRVKEALAIPTNSTQILDEVRKQERERVAQYVQQGTGDWMLGKKIAEAIRAME